MPDVEISPNSTHGPPSTALPLAADAETTTLLRMRRQLTVAALAGPDESAAERIAGTLRSFGLWDYLATVSLSRAASQPVVEGLAAPAQGLARRLQDQLIASGSQATRDQRTVMHRAVDPGGWIVACPVPASSPPRALVALSTSVGIKPPVTFLLESAAAELAAATARGRLKAAETDVIRSAAVIELLERISRCQSLSEGDHTLVNELARTIGEVTVCLGRRRHRQAAFEVTTSSEDAPPPAACETRTLLAGVMDEAWRRRRTCVFPGAVPEDEAGLLLHRQYVEDGPETWIATTPIEDGGAGAVLSIVGVDSERRLDVARLLDAASAPIAAGLATLQRARLGLLTRVRRGVVDTLLERKLIFQALAVAAAALACAMPIPHRIGCDCRVEPTVRQFVAAPFDARLEEVLVRPGDEVKADQVIATLDGREIRWELAGIKADLQRSSRERDGHLADHDSGAARLSELEMERLQLKTHLLDHRASQLELRSPIDGLVITGDLDQAVGAPLSTGQTLFELAPLGQLVVELAIPERDITFTGEGQPVEFWLDSRPDRPWLGTIQRVHPRSEIRDAENVFIAEVSVDNAEGWLRPGMSGTARVDVGTCRLGWRMFHRVWEETRIWFGM